jgi:hypothetical protein
MLELEELKQLHDKAYQNGYDTRLKAADDSLFAWITQWDDTYLEESDLGYRGEFNICRKAMRQILTDLILNPVQVDFDPVDDTDDTAANLMDGMYRADMRNNASQEAKQNASQESVVCGVGAWELRNEYKSNRAGDDKQIIKRYPLYEANNNVMWDPNAKLKDKSDANYVSCLVSYSGGGYKDLVKELTGEDMDDVSSGPGASFKSPEISYVFPWISESNKVHVTRFFHRVKQDVKYYEVTDVFGTSRTVSEFDFDADEIVESGGNVTKERKISRYVVTRYIASGEEILETTIVPGEHIPVVPQYGERAWVEGEEHYEGIIRLAKDPQRLRNFQLSYLADIVSMSPREKPIFTAEQIQGFEDMYEIGGSENNLPYLKQNAADANGNPLPIGPVGYVKAPEVPPALMLSIGESRVAVDDVAGAGLPADIMDTDLSGKAVQQLQKRLDMQSYTYQDNHKYAVRRDGEIYASMARDVYDEEREMSIVKFDGSKTKETINKNEIDYETMNSRVVNDVPEMSFDVYADIGPSFESVKAQNKEELKELINGTPPGSPQYNMLLNEYLLLVDGQGFKDVRDYARKELVMMGVKQPETDEEKQMLAQAQENKEPDAMMIAAQAEMEKAQADKMGAQTKMMDVEVDRFNAETKRQEVHIKAAEAGVKIEATKVGTKGKQIDNVLKLRGAVG